MRTQTTFRLPQSWRIYLQQSAAVQPLNRIPRTVSSSSSSGCGEREIYQGVNTEVNLFQWHKFLCSRVPSMHHYTVVMPELPLPPEEKCDYPRGIHTLIMILQLIVGGISIGLVADMGSYQAQAVLSQNEFTVNAFISFGESTALMMVSYGCLMTTFLLLVSSLISIRTFHHVPKSPFFVLYHLVSASLYLACGLSVVVLGYQRRYEQSYITAGAMGIVNAIFYIFSTCLGLRALQSLK